MTSYSDYLKSSFMHMHKAKGNNFGSNATTSAKANNLNLLRKQTRNSFMLNKRNIDDNIELTPLKTDNVKSPQKPTKSTNKAPNKAPNNKTVPNRLEQLQKWKAERDMKKQIEKKKAKPIFKVTHVNASSSLTDLETANKFIKGKPITKSEKKFAPENFKFKPPPNLKPLTETTKTKTTKKGTTKTVKKTKEPIVQIAPKVTRSQTLKASSTNKTTLNKKPVQNNKTDKNVKHKNTTVKSMEKLNNKKEESLRNVSKNVNASVVDLTDSPVDVIRPKSTVHFRKSIVDLTDSPETLIQDQPSKTYPKTPIKSSRSTMTSIAEVSTEDSFELEDSVFEDLRINEKQKTPRYKQQQHTFSFNDKNINLNSSIVKTLSPPKRSVDTPEKIQINLNETFELVEDLNSCGRSGNSTDKELSVKKINVSPEEIEVLKTPKRVTRSSLFNNATPKQTPQSIKKVKLQDSNFDLSASKKQKTPTPKKQRTSSFNVENIQPKSSTDKILASSKRSVDTSDNVLKEELQLNSYVSPVLKTPKRVTRSSINTATPKHSLLKNKTPKSSTKEKLQQIENNLETDKEIMNSERNQRQEKSNRNSPKTPKQTTLKTPKSNKKIMSYAQVLRGTSNKQVNTPNRSGKKSSTVDKNKQSFTSSEDDDKENNKLTPSVTRKKNKNLVRQNAVDVGERKENEALSHTKTINSTSSTDSWASSDYPVGSATDSPSEIESNFSESPKTPLSSEQKLPDEERPVYVSPFVTVSRGKDSARKEFHSRHSKGGVMSNSLCGKIDIEKNTSPKAGSAYFTRLLNIEIAKIEKMCDEWSNYKETENPCESACDMINTAIGQSNLLLTKKFNQFRGFIEQCLNGAAVEKPVTCTDLHGFWEVIYMQVQDLNKRFANLQSMKENDWEEIRGVDEKKPVKKRGRPKKTVKKATATSSLRDAIRARRKANNAGENDKLFDGGFFFVKSPQNFKESPTSLGRTPNSTVRKSLLASVLTNEANRRRSSPGMAIMMATQNAKISEGATPAKSILKTDGSKSAKKSVLFKDISNEKTEEINEEVIESPLPKRTSNRLRLSRNKLF